MNRAGTQPLDGAPVARVLVAGANGFTGALVAKIVWDHPNLELVAATSRSDAGKRLDALYPRYRVPVTLTELDLDDIDSLGIDAAIVAYPHGAAAPTDAALRAAGVKVVDLSADFRLRDMDTYERWYGNHGAPETAMCTCTRSMACCSPAGRRKRSRPAGNGPRPIRNIWCNRRS